MDDVVMPWAFGGTRMALDHSLAHSLTHSILKGRLNTVLLPRRECERAIAAWRRDFIQRKANKPKSVSCQKTVKATLRSIYCGLLLFGRFCLTSVISWYLPNRLFFVADSIYQSYWCNFYGKCCAGINKFLEYSVTEGQSHTSTAS